MEERDLQRSPSLARLLKRRPSFSRPPIRTLYSPKLTEDEAEMLTSPFLQYRTRYTYANSACYDPDLPNSWEVPNLANAGLEINAPLSHIHLSSPSAFRVTWLYICWIVEVIAYFVKKIFITLFKEGPLAVLVVLYDLLSLIYLFCCSVVRRTAAFLRDTCYAFVGLFKSSRSVEDAEDEERSFFSSIWETIVYIVLFPARAVFWTLDRTGKAVLDVYGNMSTKRYNLRPYRPQRRESDEAEEIAVNFGGDESISSINDDDDQYIQDAPTVRRRVQRSVHNLRNRVITDEITDTEDEGFSEKRPIRLHTSTPIRRAGHKETLHFEDENARPPTKATKIAHALGSASSTFVAGVYWVAIEFLMIFSRMFHSATTGAQRAVSALTPNRNRKVMQTRKQQEAVRRSTRFRPMVVDTDDEPEEYEENVHLEQEQTKKFPLLVSLSGFLLGSAKFFLSCCFAVVDLFRMARDSTLTSIKRLFSKQEPTDSEESSPEPQESSKRGGLLILAPVEYVVNKTAPLLMAFGRIVFNIIVIPFAFFWWLGEYVYNGIRSSKKSKLLLWLLPLLLLLLILLARNSDNKQYLAVGKQAEQLKETVSNYVAETWKSIDSEGSYAKSMNSIYDEYYSRGQYSIVGLADRVKNFFGSIFSFFSNIFYSIVSFVYRFVSYIWELIIAFLNLFVQAWRQIVIFSKSKVVAIPSIPSMGTIKKTAYSYYEAIPAAPAMLYPSYYSEYVPTKEGISNYSVWLLSLPGVLYNNIKSHEVFEKSTEQKIAVGTPVVPAAIPPPPAPTKEQVVKIIKEYIHVPAPAAEAPKIDEDKLIKEITAKVQAEMELKLEAFKASYQQEIKEISEINVKQNVEVDYSHLENLIRQAIYQYDADKTGLFDFALESAGASVISTRCSESYNTYSRLEKIWNIPLWYSSYGPRTVIQRNSNSLFPGECWSFKSGVGFLTVDLSHQINISSVSYEHIAKDQAPDGNRSSAPKTFKLWAYKTENDFQSRFLLGPFEYKLDEHPLQFFVIKRHPDFPVKIIEMEVTSNYGADFTCLYRLRVHGQIYRSP